MTWTHFPTSKMLKTSQRRSLNNRHLCLGLKYTPAPVLCWSIASLSHGNPTLRAGLRQTYETIPTTCLRRVNSTDISSVWSSRRAWRRNMTTCWRQKTLLCVSQASKTGIMSMRLLLACQMIKLSGSGNYSLSRIWDVMTINNSLSNTGIETSSTAWDCWCGS